MFLLNNDVDFQMEEGNKLLHKLLKWFLPLTEADLSRKTKNVTNRYGKQKMYAGLKLWFLHFYPEETPINSLLTSPRATSGLLSKMIVQAHWKTEAL